MEFPDVNVLVALFYEYHPHHLIAKEWFDTVHNTGWATCPLTQNGFVRVLANPTNTDAQLTSYEIAIRLCKAIFEAGDLHEFWNDHVSFCDSTIFDLKQVKGYRQLSDIYLLGLCQSRRATLVTFDTAIPTMLSCIVTPHANLVRVLK